MDDYHLKYALDHSLQVYQRDCGIYREYDENNAELHEKLKKEIMAYWVGELLLTEDEIEKLISADYVSYSELNELVETIKERRYK